MKYSIAFLIFACVAALVAFSIFFEEPKQSPSVGQNQIIQTSPFRPYLITNRDDSMCQPFMALVDWEFGHAQATSQNEPPINSFEQVKGSKILGNFVIRYDVPILGQKEKAVILERRSWLANSQTYLLSFIPRVSILSQIYGMDTQGYFNNPDHFRAQERLSAGLEPATQSERELWLRTGDPISRWREPIILTSEGRSFFRDTRWAYPDRPIEFTGLVEILAGGNLKQVCSARILPDQEKRALLEEAAGMSRVNHVIDEIAGGDSSNSFCSRTAARANARLIVASTKFRHDALIRPWALKYAETTQDDTAKNLERWSLQSVRASSLLAELAREIRRTGSTWNTGQPTLVDYYLSEFSVDTPTAFQWANRAIRVSLSSRFGFPGNYVEHRDLFGGPYPNSMARYFPSVRERARNREMMNARPPDLMLQDALRFGISKRRPIGQIEWILKDARALGIDLRLDNYVLDATHNIELIKLLVSYGANVNSTNGINKTTLMSAAHFGNADSVEYLISQGVDTNFKTNSDNPNSYCNPRLNYDARTALMYAAENAPPHSILRITSALLSAGASPDVTDTKGRSIEDYLAINTKLSDSIRTEIRDLLSEY